MRVAASNQGDRLCGLVRPEATRRCSRGVDPEVNVMLDLVRRATGVNDCGGRRLASGYYKDGVEIEQKPDA